MVSGYCFKCKAKVEIEKPKYECNELGRPIVTGSCKKCGGKIYKFLSKEDAAKAGLKCEPKKGSRKSRKSGGGSRKSRKSGGGSRKSRKSGGGSHKSRKGSRKSRKGSRKSRKGSRKSRK